MATTHPPIVFHEPKHQHPEASRRHKQARFPPIPDLRFERSYLRSIQPYVQFHRVGDEHTSLSHSFVEINVDDDDEKSKKKAEHEPSEIISIQLGHVLWVTARDQVFSPLLQGTVWAIISFYLTPISAELGRSLHQKRNVIREGLGVGWLRGWVQKMGLRQDNGTGKRF
ncbi:hypothetical protein VNI00_006599 [Paramarasmius palmivorus]|uniref:Uncharacterized protein n=1 Tax=Paramarasmius palmivorus TaxID=297713 RepID=A0AAW0D8H3_9AGAR